MADTDYRPMIGAPLVLTMSCVHMNGKASVAVNCTRFPKNERFFKVTLQAITYTVSGSI